MTDTPPAPEEGDDEIVYDEPPFRMVPDTVAFHDDLKDVDVRLFIALAWFARSGNGAFPGRKALAKKIKKSSVRTIDEALNRLIIAGFLTVTARYHKDGGRRSSLYRLHSSPMPPEQRRPRPERDVRKSADEDPRQKTAQGGQAENCLDPQAKNCTTPRRKTAREIRDTNGKGDERRRDTSDSFADAQESAPGGQQSSLLGDEHPAPAPKPKKTSSRKTKERTPEEQARFEQADEIARTWWKRCNEKNIPNLRRSNTGNTGFVGFRQMLERALASDFTVNELKWALDDLSEAFPSNTRLQNAVAKRRGVIPQQGSYGKPRTRVHIDNVPQAERDYAAAAFGETPKTGASW